MEEDRRFCVYVLLRPDYPDPFYVWLWQPFYFGKGIEKRRLFYHRKEAIELFKTHKKKNIKIKIIHKLWREELDFKEIVLFDNLTEQEALDLEVKLIKKYGRIDKGTGCLANLTDGGEGFSGIIHTEERKEWNSKRMKELWKTEEYREKMEKVVAGENHPMYGKHHTEESRKKMSEVQKSFSEEFYYERLSNRRNRIIQKAIDLVEKYKNENHPFMDRLCKNIPVIELKLKLLIIFNKCTKSRKRIKEECGFCNYHFINIPKPHQNPKRINHTLPTKEQWKILKKVLGINGKHELDKYFINPPINDLKLLFDSVDGDFKKLTNSQRYQLRKLGYDIPKFERVTKDSVQKTKETKIKKSEDAAFEACGHRDWKKCIFCHKYDDPKNMGKHSKKCYCHKECSRRRRLEIKKSKNQG